MKKDTNSDIDTGEGQMERERTSTAFTFQGVFDKLATTQGPITFACENPHWWIGRNDSEKFFYQYECCDLCVDEGNSDYEEADTLEQLLELAKHLKPDSNVPEWEWQRVRQAPSDPSGLNSREATGVSDPNPTAS